MSEFSETLARVRYKDTDQMGVVYYGNYFTFFEVGRVEYMRERGIAYKQMEREDDSYIMVTEASCRYLRPARYDDLLRIRTRVSESRRRSIRFSYEILRHDSSELLATGETVRKMLLHRVDREDVAAQRFAVPEAIVAGEIARQPRHRNARLERCARELVDGEDRLACTEGERERFDELGFVA